MDNIVVALVLYVVNICNERHLMCAVTENNNTVVISSCAFNNMGYRFAPSRVVYQGEVYKVVFTEGKLCINT